MKRILVVLGLIVSLSLVACGKETKETAIKKNEDIVKEEIIKKEVDYKENFKGINGSAVFFTPEENMYNIYNKELSEKEISPYSTFKILTSLMGLSKDVVKTPDTKLGYDGTIHWREQWNRDIPFKEAFRESCVWYYEKIVDSLDKEYVQKILNELDYGNKDISAWNENGHNTFWISSSLKISAMEHVEVLSKIFEEKTSFEEKDIEMVKDFMLVKTEENYKVYGKTGSGSKKNSWFTGFFEKDEKKTYFAVVLDDDSKEVSGAIAKEIVFDIIARNFK
ncbi:penicillin-binding transpeptidase domain-containing protein [uncultured Clostridium sp.]|uniref:penicillin-binding transpeptidase domain-containing protein n=1 Tax=uncultured Clostridium sp. TaxID=59620 RepID=UPI00260513D8|nr:penicillin-binding transpeptidase domain-containing protein [uncultured Clostridium sp.]